MVSNLAAGGKLVMMHHFDPERALELIEREKIGTFGGVPAMVMQVLDSPNFSKYDTSSIRGVSYGGAPAPPDLVRRIREAWPIGQPSNGYGLTETSSVTSMNSGGDYVAKPDSVGPPVPVCDVAVVPEDFAGDEPDDTIPRGPDVRGELWIKGPNVVRGYWNRPEETAKTFTEGWLHTGDVAQLDEENFIYIVDRAKDMIIRGGENVYSVQVEAALFEHPAVADCAVIGVPHPTLGEEVGAVVVLRPGAKVTADELELHVKARLAGFMVPTHIWFRSEPLPRNPQGKVLEARAPRRARPAVELRAAPTQAESGGRPVIPRRRSSNGASSGTGTAAGKTPMARHSSACGLTSSQTPCTSSSGRSGPPRSPGRCRGPAGPGTEVDLPEVLPHRVVAEGQVRHGVQIRHRRRRRTGPVHDGLEVRHGVLPQEVPVELVPARLLHGPPGQHVGHPGVVVGVVVDQGPQRSRLRPAAGGERGRQHDVPLPGADPGHHAGQGPIGQHEDLGFSHRSTPRPLGPPGPPGRTGSTWSLVPVSPLRSRHHGAPGAMVPTGVTDLRPPTRQRPRTRTCRPRGPARSSNHARAAGRTGVLSGWAGASPAGTASGPSSPWGSGPWRRRRSAPGR